MALPTKARILDLLRQALGDVRAEFRDGQWECISALLGPSPRWLVVQRTGWGKSMLYFLVTRVLRDRNMGPTLLISPLLALMRNQIQAAERLGLRAASINSSNVEDWRRVEAAVHADHVDLLLVSPERLANEEFRENVLLPMAARIGMFVVDEAHCISDWGHDFRPDYRRIVRILNLLPKTVPVLATTATANDRVIADVQQQLGSELQVQRGPLTRAGLRLQNIMLPGRSARMAWLAHVVPHIPGSGIIYTLTVRDSEWVAGWLQKHKVEAYAYHADVEAATREELEGKLLANKIKALVATTALGMGFDKPDLSFVIHFQRPGSVVHYYQQVGRAGRALETAYGAMLCGEEDEEIINYFIKSAFPPDAEVDMVLRALEGAQDGLSIRALQRDLNLSQGRIEKVLKILAVETPAPVSQQQGKWFRNPVRYAIDKAKIEGLKQIRGAEQACRPGP